MDNMSTEEYLCEMTDFKSNVKKFYDCREVTFLSSSTDKKEDEETFYLHTLRFYMPEISDETFKKHNWEWGYSICRGLKGERQRVRIV